MRHQSEVRGLCPELDHLQKSKAGGWRSTAPGELDALAFGVLTVYRAIGWWVGPSLCVSSTSTFFATWVSDLPGHVEQRVDVSGHESGCVTSWISAHALQGPISPWEPPGSPPREVCSKAACTEEAWGCFALPGPLARALRCKWQGCPQSPNAGAGRT